MHGPEVHFTVRAVPKIIQEVHGKISNGVIQVKEFRGNLNLQTSNGSITLALSDGQINLRTSNGSISLEEVTLTDSSVIRTSNGHIEGSVVLPLTGSYTFTTANGNINLQMPADTMGNFKLKASRGIIDVKLGKDILHERTNAQLFREHGPSISITTSNGNIVIRETLLR